MHSSALVSVRDGGEDLSKGHELSVLAGWSHLNLAVSSGAQDDLHVYSSEEQQDKVDQKEN